MDEEQNLQKLGTAVGSARQRDGSNRPVVKGSVPLIRYILTRQQYLQIVYARFLYIGVNIEVYTEVYIGVNIGVNIEVNIGVNIGVNIEVDIEVYIEDNIGVNIGVNIGHLVLGIQYIQYIYLVYILVYIFYIGHSVFVYMKGGPALLGGTSLLTTRDLKIPKLRTHVKVYLGQLIFGQLIFG